MPTPMGRRAFGCVSLAVNRFVAGSSPTRGVERNTSKWLSAVVLLRLSPGVFGEIQSCWGQGGRAILTNSASIKGPWLERAHDHCALDPAARSSMQSAGDTQRHMRNNTWQ